MKKTLSALVLFGCVTLLPAIGSAVVQCGDDKLRVTLADGGWIESFDTGQRVDFRQDQYHGPSWFWNGQPVPLSLKEPQKALFEGALGPVRFSLRYEVRAGKVAIVAGVKNNGDAVRGVHAMLRLGLDTYMVKFPDWSEKFFPTLLRCEKTHFWGYAMTPSGRILGISSPEPIASWHHDYRPPTRHRIITTNLDLLNPAPLPARHPPGLDSLQAGEEKQWTIYLEVVPSLDQVKPRLAATTGAPMLECDRYTVAPGEEVNVTVFGGKNRLYRPGDKPGVYTLTETNAAGKIAEAKITVRRPWSWYAKRARAEAVAKPQKGSSHTESWYGFFSCFNAQRLFPDEALDAAAAAKFAEIWPLMYDMQKMTPTSQKGRIQNHACAAGLMAAKYRATGDVKDLEFAASLADFLLTKQSSDGAYRRGRSHYTSVVYIGKSLLEVMAEEKKLAGADAKWAERYQRHYASVRRAMDELAKSRDNIGTEGEPTYEDGMISCSYSQLAMFALMQDDPAARQKYLDAALYLADGHRCLSQILVPDSRMNGGSLRFWEAQYDVLTTPNMISSPHGWSAWRIYGLWYLYQLTGKEDYLRQTMNALGSCVQVIDGDTGELRWAFISDPYVEAKVFEPDPAQPGRGRRVDRVLGEQYLPMISGWHKAPPGKLVSGYGAKDGGSCDNDVHEIFKCLEEVALTSAYVLERPTGEMVTWNCALRDGRITPAEPIVTAVHYNVRKPQTLTVEFADKKPLTRTVTGMGWIK